jgi:ATP-binding cassette, subfamily B, bacterial MsbA
VTALALMAAVALVNGFQALAVRVVGCIIEENGNQTVCGLFSTEASGFGVPVSEPFRALLIAAAMVVVIGLMKGSALFGQVLVTQRLSLKVIEDLQNAMYGALLKADFARLAAESPGKLAARFTSDVERVREGVARSITNLGRDLMTVIVMIAVMFAIDWTLALLVLIVYPLIFKPVIDIGSRVRNASTHAQEQMGDIGAFLTEGFSGARLIKAYRLERGQNEKASRSFAERFDLSVKIARGRASVEPVLEIVGALAFAGVVVYVAWRASRGGYALSDVLGFIAALAILAPAIRAIGTLNPVVQEGLAALARIFSILDEQPSITSKPGAPALAIHEARVVFSGVRFAYPDGTEALRGIDLELAPGTTTALVGPSGSGKTTLMNLIPRLFDVSGGEVSIDGQDIRAVTLSSLRSKIALVSQEVTLFADTVRANVAMGRPGASDQDIWDALEVAAARTFVAALAQGLDTPVGDAGARLSGGQRQRLALARAVLRDAPILLLDEATSALDAEAEAQVQTALERLAKGRTTLVIAHRLATVANADRVLVMQDGVIVESGTDASLKARKDGIYARLRALQFEQ